MLIDLKKSTGLPLAVDAATCKLIYDPAEVSCERSSVRTLAEMRSYIRNEHSAASSEHIYYMYRNVARHGDRDAIKARRIRYDITVIPPGRFILAGESEFFRTAGHYHPLKAGTSVAYPEAYEVLSGRALWILQRPHGADVAALSDIYLVEAGVGEKAVMLPGYGHVSVNVTDEPLVMANWIGDTFTYDYTPYQKLRGSGVWIMGRDGSTGYAVKKNTNYALVPDAERVNPKDVPEFGLVREKPMYGLVSDLDALAFLLAPEEFASSLTEENCFVPASDQ